MRVKKKQRQPRTSRNNNCQTNICGERCKATKQCRRLQTWNRMVKVEWKNNLMKNEIGFCGKKTISSELMILEWSAVFLLLFFFFFKISTFTCRKAYFMQYNSQSAIPPPPSQRQPWWLPCREQSSHHRELALPTQSYLCQEQPVRWQGQEGWVKELYTLSLRTFAALKF